MLIFWIFFGGTCYNHFLHFISTHLVGIFHILKENAKRLNTIRNPLSNNVNFSSKNKA